MANVPHMIVVHNHPSGDPVASADDIAMTRKLIAGSRLLDIDVQDHVIVARDAAGVLRSYSMKRRWDGWELSRSSDDYDEMVGALG